MYDVIIVGGGPAGLSAALNFGRGLTAALVIDNN
ncbi:FAD-binding protein [Jeotgalicoccus sp. S0W5]|nr:FAD-binding protein [Jeotgalicoccus sp. S0W5]